MIEHAPGRDRALDLLKWLAMLSMVLDHARYLGLPLDPLFVPGRLAFAFFCLAIAANLRRNAQRPTDNRRELRYLGWLTAFALASEWPYRLYIPDIDTLNVMPTLVCGLLVATAAQRRTLGWSAVGALVLIGAWHFHAWLMFDFFGVLLPAAMVFALRFAGTRWQWLVWMVPGLVCLAANDWPLIIPAAARGSGLFQGAFALCLLGPAIGLALLRWRVPFAVPAMRRWAYGIYPLHFLALLAMRQILA